MRATALPDALIRLACTAALFAAPGLHAAPADEVAESITRANQEYARGHLDAAATQLEHAARLIRERRSAAMAAFLPPPLAGWFAAPGSAGAVADALPGVGASAMREYLQGERTIQVRILADAPAVQAALQVLGAPAFATADGARALRVRGQPGMLKFDRERRSGRLTLIVAQRYLVYVEGIDVAAEELQALAEAIDVAGLARAN